MKPRLLCERNGMFEDVQDVAFSTRHEEPEKNYGADISTLIRMIEAGEL